MVTATVTDLFAGAGGSSEGLHRAGFDIVTAANHWPVALATHALNHPDTEHRSDNLSEVDWRTFPSTDVLWASPSCVWHARAGGRKRPPAEVERQRADAGAIDRATAFAVIAAAEVHRYPVILVENVVEFTKWSLYAWWLDGLGALGYTVRTLVLDAADFGHAQYRPRWFAVATRGLDIDLTLPAPVKVPASQILDPHPGEPVTRRLYVTPQIEQITEPDIPYLVTYRNHANAHRADRSPLASVSAGGNHHAVARIIDGRPWHRMLTDRERARAQGFPDTYRFTAKKSGDVIRQIGNAVPVGVAEWLGRRAAAALDSPAAAVPDDLFGLLALTGTEA